MSALLFAYGTLAPGNERNAAAGGWTSDRVRGRLYDLGAHPALVDVEDPCADWVEGYVRAVDLATLAGPLDEYEGVADGLFNRTRVTTETSRLVWIYVYNRAIPPGAPGPLTRWDGPRVGLPGG